MAMSKLFRNEEGFNLIEIIFTISLLAFGLLSIASIIPFGARAVEESTKKAIAINLANQAIEKLKAADFEDLNNTKFPFEDFGDIPGYPDFARTYEFEDATDSSSNPLPQLKMVTITVFWIVTTQTHTSHDVYVVTYIGPNFIGTIR